jgi:ubiquinone/menaquinone biosynthesis C-methylase UbiE
MTKLGTGAFTGDQDNHPYHNDLKTAIDYDILESGFSILDHKNNISVITTGYRFVADRLVGYLDTKEGDEILDVGSGTGITTLELVLQNPNIKSVRGVDISKGMTHLSSYKFHKLDEKSEEIFKHVGNDKVEDYWKNFRKESLPYKDKVSFINADFLKYEENFKEKSFDGVIASQFMHWVDLSSAFKKMHQILKDGKNVVWNSASHFFNDATYPTEMYGMRYNDFIKYVMEEVSKEVTVKDYKTLSVPKHNIDTIKKISSENGFETKQVAVHLIPYDYKFVRKYHIPAFVKALTDPNINPEFLKEITDRAIAKTINNPNALDDTINAYDIDPIFVSTKQ